MKRRTLRVVLAAIVVIGVPAVLFRGGVRVAVDNLVDIARLNTDALPGLLQRIRTFRRTVTRNGEKLLEVSAKEARYYRDRSTVEILEPKIVFFDHGVEAGEISGQSGLARLDGNEIQSISVRGSVRFRLAQFVVETEGLTYDRERQRIVAEGASSIRSPEFTLHGSGITVDLREQTLRVDADVDMSLRKVAGEDEQRASAAEKSS